MSRNYFIVLKNFNKCDYYGVYVDDGKITIYDDYLE